MKMFKKVFLVLFSSVFLFGCDDDLKPGDNNVFDSITLLDNIVDQHLIPEFEKFNADLKALELSKTTFVEEPSSDNLQDLRNAYLTAYFSFQPIGKYESNVTENLNYYLNLNAHPLALSGITEFILNYENENFASIQNQDRQGFPALDYLLYGLGDNDEAIVSFFTGANAVSYKGYLDQVVSRITTLTAAVSTDFVNRADQIRDESGFANSFYNTYVEHLEKRVRSSKIDFPAGKFDGSPSPETIESLFNPSQSKALLIEAFDDVQLFYLGTEESTLSWSKILIELGEDGLDAKVKLAFLEAENAIEALDDNLKLQVETENAKMLATRDKIQKVVTLLKVDLVSVLGISITFIDNDGD